MNAGRLQQSTSTQPQQVAVSARLDWSVLDEAWHQGAMRMQVQARMPLSAEERYRAIDLAAERLKYRLHVSPESNLRDWLDAEEEVKSP